MRKYFVLLLSISLCSCTIDWDDSKTKKINELESKIEKISTSLEEQNASNKQQENKQTFENNLKCQERADKLKIQYNNVISGTYNTEENNCYIAYLDTETKKVKDWPMDTFWPSSLLNQAKESSEMRDILQDVQFRECASVTCKSKWIIYKWSALHVNFSNVWEDWSTWYNVNWDWDTWWINQIAFIAK